MNLSKQCFLSKALRVHNIRMEAENGEEGGDSGELVPARSMRFTGIELTKKQFNWFYGHDAAADFYYDYSEGGKGTPAHENVGTIWLDQTYKNCKGVIIFGTSRTEVEFENARFKNLSIKVKGEPRFGKLAGTLVAPLPVKLAVLQLEAFFGKMVGLKIILDEVDEDGDKDQQQLELEGGKAGDDEGEGEQAETGDDENRGTRQRNPASDEQRPH